MAEQRHGRYRLVRELGRGGMGTVYEAVDDQLHRSVALKVLHPLLCAQPGLVARFAAEARVAAQLDHPNIVPIYDVGTSRGVPFMAMKLVRGQTFQEVLAAGSPSAVRYLDVIRHVAAALDHAHSAGVVHRDVKPGNVLIGEDGQASVTDFGIASIYGSTRHTAADAVIGTPEYIAPECVLGKPPSPASDIYALAVIAYEIAAGHRPFAGSAVAVLHAHVYDPPSLTGLGPSLQKVLLRGLAKDPAERFPTASALAACFSDAVVAVPRLRAECLETPTALHPRPALDQPERRPWQRPLAPIVLLLSVTAAVWLAQTTYPLTAGAALSGLARATSAAPSPLGPAAPVAPDAFAQAAPALLPTSTPAPTPAPAPLAANQQIISLAAGQTEYVRVALLPGDRVTGSLVVSGGTILGIGSDVVFRVSGPEGVLLNVGRVERQHKFQFSATLPGEYRLSFQNPSSLMGRQIALMLVHPDRH